MTRHDANHRISSVTSASTDSGRSSVTVKPSNYASSSPRRRHEPRGSVDEPEDAFDDPTVPSTSSTSRPTYSASSGLGNLANYRRDLSVLETRLPKIQHSPPTAGPSSQIAPWMTSNDSGAGAGPYTSGSTFFNDSNDSISMSSQLSPGQASASTRGLPGSGGQESPDASYSDEGRRPSVASIISASSQGSKTSGHRGGLRKLQGFFGEEFPGRDSSESSLPTSVGKDQQHKRSYSNSRTTHRDRKFSNATDNTRDPSPSSSRPRTPVPAPEVVPFLYQDNTDIARYGEAPVRDILTGPDRERYMAEGSSSSQNPPKTSSSARSGHSIAHLAGHHRHNKSNDDPRSLRPSVSRDESLYHSHAPWERMGSTPMISRAQSPTPSTQASRTTHVDGGSSPGHHGKRRYLPRFPRRHKDKDESEAAPPTRLWDLPQSTRSLLPKSSKADLTRPDPPPSFASTATWVVPEDHPEQRIEQNDQSRMGPQRGATFSNIRPFAKKTRTGRPSEEPDEAIGPTEHRGPGHVYHLDTNLNDMEGILTKPQPLTPLDAGFVNAFDPDRRESAAAVVAAGPQGHWDAPDSWAVRRNTGDDSFQVPEMDEIGSPIKPEENAAPYCIRIFRSDGTFSTHSMPLHSSVADVISQVIKKTYVVDGLENYHIILKKHHLIRILSPQERPLLLQKQLLQQIGYDDRDRIEDLGREDNSYLCRFMFLSARESDFHSKTADLNFNVHQSVKGNHVDLSGRNLITIPISLYLKAPDIISLNLSRNLSLDVPRDFMQSCKNLREIKFNNNEARRLPPSLSRAGKLVVLDASNNRVDRLDHAELDTVTTMLKLNFANNRLKAMPSYFGTYTSLRSLNISSNFLEKFPPFLCEMRSLVDLDLSFNSISSLPNEIGDLKNLEKLLITNNRLSKAVPDSFRGLWNLRDLDIKYNSITNIDAVSALPKLEMLNAAHNQIAVFVGKFSRLRQLKLNSNPLNKFEITEPLPTLRTLNLSHAQLASIDSAFLHMYNLESLVLDKNYFVSLPPQIGSLGRLEQFSIAHNSVGELPPQIGCLTELKTLDVRGNNISKLPMEIWWANKLETFNASSNVLDNFPKPASRPPRVPGEDPNNAPSVPPLSSSSNGKAGTLSTISSNASSEELTEERRPSQASSTLLSVGPSPFATSERKGSVVSVYGKGGRKTSVVSRSASSQGGSSTAGGPPAALRKDSGQSSRLSQLFAGSLKNLCLADNRLDDEVFDQITLMTELRVLNLSYNDEITDMPQRSIRSWPNLVELYLSGNGLTTLPADDLEETSMLQALYINGNKFTNLPADISRAKKLAVFDCGNNFLKYNISNVPYDWNWNLNPNLRYLNLSGNKRLEIKQTAYGPAGPHPENRKQYTDFSTLTHLRVLGLMDVTLIQPSIPDQNEDTRIRTSGSLAGHLPYGMADTLGQNQHLSTVDMVVPRFNSNESEMLLGLFDGQALSSGGSKIAGYLHENFGHLFANELNALKIRNKETPADALRRAFLALNKELVNMATQHTEERPATQHRGAVQPVVLSKEDLNSGGVATVIYLQASELYVANVGDAQAMVIQTDGKNHMLTRKHDPAEPSERSRIREAGGWVSRSGRLNDLLEVSRAFGYVDLMPAVQAAPFVSHRTIREHDDIILVATRELWEYLSPGLITDIARAERGDLMRAAQKLRDIAIAYGATGKIMVMMISVADMKRRVEKQRLNRNTSQSLSLYAPRLSDEQTSRRGKKGGKMDVLNSELSRLEAEIPAPSGIVSIVFTDIKNSTTLWEMYPQTMRSAIRLHNEVMRRQLRQIGGYEVKTEGDAFMVSFPTATSALLWCFAVQMQLLDVDWPAEMLDSLSCTPLLDKDKAVIFRGLSVRMGIHYGDCVSETDPVTRRMDYFGPMVNKASRISAVADGGQIAVSSDFISEIQRCLETYQDTDRLSVTGSDDTFEEESFANTIRKDLRALTYQGFEVKEMGEKKLKGLENPEVVYSLYPHALAGRIEHHTQHERKDEAVEKPAVLAPGEDLAIDPNFIWTLWRVSLRLEMLCSTLEEVRGPGLQPPETELLERMKSRGGEMTERFLLNFMEHQVSRIETCVSTLSIRHLAIGNKVIRELNELRAPMASVLDVFVQQREELERYRRKYGALPSPGGTVQEVVEDREEGDDGHEYDDSEEVTDDDVDEGSETE